MPTFEGNRGTKTILGNREHKKTNLHEALPCVLGNRGNGYLFQGNRGTNANFLGEQGNKDNIGEQGT